MLVTLKQMAAAEEKCDKTAVSLNKLMDNAALSLADFIAKRVLCGKVLFYCGSGNNGGDGMVAARILSQKGFDVSVALLCGNPKTTLAKNAFEKLLNSNVNIIDDISSLQKIAFSASALVDCVFGTGFSGTLGDDIARIFSYPTNALKISADIPSGANGLTGIADKGTFKADFTLTFGKTKAGIVMYPAREYCGEIIPCDIGIPNECYPCDETFFEIDKSFALQALPYRPKNSHKGSCGKLLCIVGSENMVGAAALCIKSALCSGVGIVKAAVPKSIARSLSSSVYEPLWQILDVDEKGLITAENLSMLQSSASDCDAVVIGCGLGISEGTRHIVKSLVSSLKCPIILDADGINCIADCIDILSGKDNIVLTPHLGEAARLLQKTIGQIENDRIDCARRLSAYGCTVVLKSASTIVAQNGRFGILSGGNSGMSKGGSGDTLAGIIAAFASQKMGLFEAAALGVYMHSQAGEIAAVKLSEYSMLPSDIIANLPKAFKWLEK